MMISLILTALVAEVSGQVATTSIFPETEGLFLPQGDVTQVWKAKAKAKETTTCEMIFTKIQSKVYFEWDAALSKFEIPTEKESANLEIALADHRKFLDSKIPGECLRGGRSKLDSMFRAMRNKHRALFFSSRWKKLGFTQKDVKGKLESQELNCAQLQMLFDITSNVKGDVRLPKGQKAVSLLNQTLTKQMNQISELAKKSRAIQLETIQSQAKKKKCSLQEAVQAPVIASE